MKNTPNTQKTDKPGETRTHKPYSMNLIDEFERPLIQAKRELARLAGDADRLAVIAINATGEGNNFSEDRIIEITIYRLDLKQINQPIGITGTWTTQVKPDPPTCSQGYGLGISFVHDIKPEDLDHAPTFPQIAGDIAERLNGACVVGHNVGYDLEIIRQEYQRLGEGSEVIPGRALSTRKIYRGTLLEASTIWEMSNYDLHTTEMRVHATSQLLRQGYHELKLKGSKTVVKTRNEPSGVTLYRPKR